MYKDIHQGSKKDISREKQIHFSKAKRALV